MSDNERALELLFDYVLGDDEMDKDADVFADNVVVPTEQPLVEEYTFPEGDFTEKTQDALYRIDAAEATRLLLLRQLERRMKEIQRQIEDLKSPDDLCD